jgi:hypothetical protein
VWEKSYDEFGPAGTSARQTQFGPAPPCDKVEWRQTNPIRPGAGRQAQSPEGETCETNPIRARTVGAQSPQGCRCCRRDPSCQTKPISWLGRGEGGPRPPRRRSQHYVECMARYGKLSAWWMGGTPKRSLSVSSWSPERLHRSTVKGTPNAIRRVWEPIRVWPCHPDWLPPFCGTPAMWWSSVIRYRKDGHSCYNDPPSGVACGYAAWMGRLVGIPPVGGRVR